METEHAGSSVGESGASARAPYEVRLCRTEAEREAVFRLRYEVYVEEMRRTQPHADHAGRRITDALDEQGELLAVFRGDALVGTGRLNRVAQGVGAYHELFGFDRLPDEEVAAACLGTALMVRAGERAQDVVKLIFRAGFAWCRVQGLTSCWIDCNPPLVPMFLAFGYRETARVRHPYFGLVHVMRLDLEDVDHLRDLRSPFVPAWEDPHAHLPLVSPTRSVLVTPTLARLRADFLVIAERFHANPACASFRDGTATKAQYASLMRAVAHQTRENPQIQAFATAFLRGHQREQVKGFLRHATSEIGHDQLAANDLATLGFPADTLFQQQPLPATIALTAFAYYAITHIHPVSYLGYLFFLEFLPTTFGAEYMAALDRMGVPVEARTFLLDHASVDVGHNKLMERYVQELVSDDDLYEHVRYAMEVTGALYARMVEDAFASVDDLLTARSLDPRERSRRAPVAPHVAA